MPEHWLAARTSNGLTLRQQSSETVSESAIVIQMLAAGVCGTDLAMLSGGRVCRAEVLGHEGVGVVVSAPENSSVAKGARVIVNPVHPTRPELVIGHSRDGVFREIFCLDSFEAVQGEWLVTCPTPCSLSNVELALAEPIASVLYSIELLREDAKATSLLIRGSGTVGLLTAWLWARLVEGSRAVVVSKSESHAQWLRETCRWPANVSVRTLEGGFSASTDGEFDAAVLCCSRQDASDGLGFLMDSVRGGATIDLMAGFPADYKEDRLGGIDLDRIRWNNIRGTQRGPVTNARDQKTGKTLHLTGHRGTSERHILQAVELLSRRIISLADLPHQVLTLEQLPDAVSKMLSPARHDLKSIKAIVAFPQHSGAAHGRD